MLDKECNNLWCGIINRETYENFMDKLNKIPLIKADKENPQSFMNSIAIILGLVVALIPAIFITFVLIS